MACPPSAAANPTVLVPGDFDCASAPGLTIDTSDPDADTDIEDLTIDGRSDPNCTTQVGIKIALDGGAMVMLARVRVLGFGTGVDATGDPMVTGARVSIGNSVMQAGATGITATEVSELQVVNTTIDAPQDISLDNSTGAIDSSILMGTGVILSGSATCTADYSRITSVTCTGANNTTAAPGFDPVSPYHLASDSPMIDAGNEGPPAVDATDIDGDQRSVDGVLDCTDLARRDIGADEYVPTGTPPDCTPPDPPAPPPPVLDFTGVKSRNRQVYLNLAGSIGGNYALCVDGPLRKRCRGFNARRSRGTFRSTVSWGDAFGTQGPGRYRVTWLQGGDEIGPDRSFRWGICPPRNQTMDGVWKPHRLIVKSPCKTISGRIARPNYYSTNDNDIHIGLAGNHPRRIEILDRDRGHMRRTGRHNRGDGPSDPHQGQRIRATGVYVCDTFHGPFGDWELHPPFRLQILSGHHVASDRISGPQHPGTPRVKLKQKGRFHCA